MSGRGNIIISWRIGGVFYDGDELHLMSYID